MGPYVAITAAEAKAGFRYSAAYWFRVITALMYVAIPLFFWQQVFAGGAKPAGLDLVEASRYSVWAALLMWVTSDYSAQVGQHIKEGRVTFDLVRPYGFLARLLAGYVGTRLSEAARVLPVALVLAVALPFSILPPLATLPYVLVAFVLGCGVAFTIDAVLGLCVVKTMNHWGLRVWRFAAMSMLSGALLPVELMPDWAAAAVRALPFQAVVRVPLTLARGGSDAMTVIGALAGQLAWLLGLAIVAVVTWRLLRPRIVVYGG